ncbi:hypothetical protein CXB37_16510 [Pseudomonas syringae pv. syringae]|nr:hypothetical protein AL061_17110 [Pseudomonas syringae pv. syringae]POP75422.1 hypothetical protein CXB37_16510 [Pseudomonas syringae pv. syringae]PYD14880.1 hypothetical protein DND47_14625 [Pseudomonas syringae pv. syringae]
MWPITLIVSGSGQKQAIAAYKMKGDSQRPHIAYVRRSDAKLNARREALKQRVQGRRTSIFAWT